MCSRLNLMVWTVGIGLVWGGAEGRQLEAQTGEAAATGDHGGIVFSCEFEMDDWHRQWGKREQPPRTATVADDSQRRFEPRDGKALRIRVGRGGHYGTSLTYRFQEQTGSEPEAIYFRYDLRLADDWNPARGGKLPGIAGTYGRAGWGGRRTDGEDGWSARGLFQGQRDGRTPIGFYCYHVDMRGRYGSHWLWEENNATGLENNRWYAIRQFVKLNTPGKNDGILRGWIDGRLVFERSNVRFRNVDSLRIETVWLNVYLGGTWTAESTHHLYIDNAMIARDAASLDTALEAR